MKILQSCSNQFPIVPIEKSKSAREIQELDSQITALRSTLNQLEEKLISNEPAAQGSDLGKLNQELERRITQLQSQITALEQERQNTSSVEYVQFIPRSL